jgi:hypothetical protein
MNRKEMGVLAKEHRRREKEINKLSNDLGNIIDESKAVIDLNKLNDELNFISCALITKKGLGKAEQQQQRYFITKGYRLFKYRPAQSDKALFIESDGEVRDFPSKWLPKEFVADVKDLANIVKESQQERGTSENVKCDLKLFSPRYGGDLLKLDTADLLSCEEEYLIYDEYYEFYLTHLKARLAQPKRDTTLFNKRVGVILKKYGHILLAKEV